MTSERDRFLNDVRALMKYWSSLPDSQCPQGETPVEWKVGGIAFSILNKLDEGYHVIPVVDGKTKTQDIAGQLHALLDNPEDKP